MKNIFHHSATWIAKHKRHHHLMLATLALIIASVGVYTYRHEFAQAATFNFTQTSWAGGAWSTPASHANNNQSGWTYSSSTPATTIILDGSGHPVLPTASYYFTDDSATSSTSGITSGGGFLSSGVAASSTVVSAGSVGLSVAVLATGGNTITTSGLYTTHKFTSNGTFTATGDITNAEYLVVGGGGGAYGSGNGTSGGGGAGGMATGTVASISQGSAYSVTVGPAVGRYSQGSNSILGSPTSTTTAYGGGYGNYNNAAGGSGGSGGGGGPGGLALVLSPMQGNNGTSTNYGGGGGGAGTAGAGCSGGAGLQWPAGSGDYYAGGGVGAQAGGSCGGVGGLGGGGGYNATGTNATGGGGGAGGFSGSGKGGGSGVVIVRYSGYVSSGTFTSAVIDLGAKADFTGKTLTWAETLNGLSAGSITMKVHAGNTATVDGSWTATTTISNGGSLSALNGYRYIQYEATLSNGGDTTKTPTLDSVTVNYSQYPSSGNLTSSTYDIGSDALVSKVTWAGATTSTEFIKFQVQSSADGSAWSGWCGYDETGTTCDGSKYFYDSPTAGFGNGVTLGTSHPLRCSAASATCPSGGTADRYFQYKAFLGSGGAVTPILTSVILQYVVNAAPIAGNVVTSGQISDPADANYGKVTFTYDVSDIDTVGGATEYKVTPTLYEYYNGTSWFAIPSGDLSSNAFTYISLTGNGATSTSPTIVWTPPSGIAYTAGAKIRATVTDGENANNLATATFTGTFTLDTTVPTISATSVDSSGVPDVVTFTATDSSALSYRLCNASCVSEAWTTGITSAIANHINYTLTGAPNAETVYIQARDLYGNLSTVSSVTAPATPGSFLVADVSNPGAGTYGETLSWIAPSGATSYNIYYATTSASTVAPSVYTSLAMGVTSNVYAHTITTATTSAYWYKVSAIGNSNTSNFATENTGDVPDSFGTALSDTTAPTVLSVATSSVLSTSAVVTVTTNELASIQIFYSPAGYVSGCLYTAHTQPSAVYATSTVVTLTGLSPSTTYNFCVKATDIAGNPSLGTSSTENSSFVTVSGPGMVGAPSHTVTSNTATVNWTTSTSSDSYVTYGTPGFGTNNKRIGVSTYTTTTDGSGNYVHAITLTGLTAGTDYYYQVESSNINGTTIDTNSGAYYYLRTTIDTTPPIITGTSTPVIAPDKAVIVWQTDEMATSKVDYDTTVNYIANSSYGKGVAEDPILSIYHVMTLSSGSQNSGGAGDNTLVKETPYSYRVTSKDAANNTATATGTFTTPADGTVNITYVTVRSSAGDTTKDTTPPSISNVVVSDITPFGATVKFGTSEDANAFVKFGKDISYGDAAGDDAWGTTHTVKLHGLTLGTEYHIKVASQDKAGNTGTSADQTFKTTFLSENLKDMANVENIEQFQKEIESAIESILPSLVPPFVSKPQVSDITEGGATITFKTNIKAFPVVVYAEDGAYDETKESPYTGEVSDTTEKATSHELALTGLKGNTKYHVQARGFSLPKVIGKSADVTFITKASKIAGSIVERKKDSFTVVWTTEEPTSSIVEFKDLKRGITERKVDEAKKTSHSMKVENLPSGTAYEVNLSGLTEQGNIAEAGSPLSVTTSTDTTPPTISGFKVDNALVPGRTDRIQTIVSWMTDEPSNSTVYYEEGAGTAGETKELANKNETLDSYTTNHSTILPSLKPGTIYRLKVTSADDSGNLGSFGPRTVITPQQTASITDIIFKNFEDSFKFMRKM